MFPGIGFGEMLLIGVVAVLLFGSRLPEVARSLGSSYQQFRKGLNEITSSIHTDVDQDYSSSKYGGSAPRRLPDYQDYQDDYDPPPAPNFVPPSDDELNETSV